MRLYSYVVRRDFGFAPNPFFGYCTLATCKPQIRKSAQVGDWVAGTGSKPHGLGHRLVYAMRVGETLTFDEYWEDLRFRQKRPNLRASIKQAFGDNIYHHAANRKWCQERSHHSHRNDKNAANMRTDTQVDRILVSDWFIYFGGNAVEIPEHLRQGKGRTVVREGRSHLVNIPPDLVDGFVEWVTSLGEGLMGEPREFRKQLARPALRTRRSA
jgi:hypothetical protein